MGSPDNHSGSRLPNGAAELERRATDFCRSGAQLGIKPAPALRKTEHAAAPRRFGQNARRSDRKLVTMQRRLIPLTSGNEPKLAELFARAELKRSNFCRGSSIGEWQDAGFDATFSLPAALL